jgi:hypothetical protein
MPSTVLRDEVREVQHQPAGLNPTVAREVARIVLEAEQGSDVPHRGTAYWYYRVLAPGVRCYSYEKW